MEGADTVEGHMFVLKQIDGRSSESKGLKVLSILECREVTNNVQSGGPSLLGSDQVRSGHGASNKRHTFIPTSR